MKRAKRERVSMFAGRPADSPIETRFIVAETGECLRETRARRLSRRRLDPARGPACREDPDQEQQERDVNADRRTGDRADIHRPGHVRTSGCVGGMIADWGDMGVRQSRRQGRSRNEGRLL